MRFTALLVWAACTALAAQPQTQPQTSSRYSWVEPGPFGADYMAEFAAGIGYDRLPRTNALRVAPQVGRWLLREQELVTEEHLWYYTRKFRDEQWGECQWQVRCFEPTTKPLPTSLPQDRLDSFMKSLPSQIKEDPARLKAALDDQLAAYHNLLKYEHRGWFGVYILLCPNNEAAYESLLLGNAFHSAPTELIIASIRASEQVEGLGTASLVARHRNFVKVDLVRDNVYIKIEGGGVFAAETINVAKKLDEAILRQPTLSYEQLVARRPMITAGTKIMPEWVGRESIDYSVVLPVGIKVVKTQGWLDGYPFPAGDGKVLLTPKPEGPHELRLLVVSSELLVAETTQAVLR